MEAAIANVVAGGLGTAASAALTGVAALGSIQAGYAQKAAMQQQAEARASQLKEQELQRLQAIRKVQAQQRAYFAGQGISPFEGSPETIRRQSVRNYQLERGALQASAGRDINRLNMAGQQAVTAGWVKAAGLIGQEF